MGKVNEYPKKSVTEKFSINIKYHKTVPQEERNFLENEIEKVIREHNEKYEIRGNICK